MRNFILLLLLLGWMGCTDDASVNDQNTENTTTTTEITEEGNAQSRPSKGAKGSFLPPLDPGEGTMVTTLTADYWVFEFYVAEERADRAANKGRWFKFAPDGTYESGIWQEQIGYGVWRIQEEPEGLMLYLDNIDDSQDEKWEIQGVNDVRDTMTWAGLSETNTAGVITKVINLLTMPTKKQFGVDE